MLGMLAPMYVAERLDVWIPTRCAERNDRSEVGTLGSRCRPIRPLMDSRRFERSAVVDSKLRVVVPQPADAARIRFGSSNTIARTGLTHGIGSNVTFVLKNTPYGYAGLS